MTAHRTLYRRCWVSVETVNANSCTQLLKCLGSSSNTMKNKHRKETSAITALAPNGFHICSVNSRVVPLSSFWAEAGVFILNWIRFVVCLLSAVFCTFRHEIHYVETSFLFSKVLEAPVQIIKRTVMEDKMPKQVNLSFFRLWPSETRENIWLLQDRWLQRCHLIASESWYQSGWGQSTN